MAESKSTRGSWGKSPERRRARKHGLRAQTKAEIDEGKDEVYEYDEWMGYDE